MSASVPASCEQRTHEHHLDDRGGTAHQAFASRVGNTGPRTFIRSAGYGRCSATTSS
jgi:hypothetical protein